MVAYVTSNNLYFWITIQPEFIKVCSLSGQVVVDDHLVSRIREFACSLTTDKTAPACHDYFHGINTSSYCWWFLAVLEKI